MTLLIAICSTLPFVLLGWHLGRIARESGGLPDRLLSMLFYAVALGTPLRIIAVDLVTNGSGANQSVLWLNSGGNLFVGFGTTCFAAFTWKVFRPDAKGARLAVYFAGGFYAIVTLVGLTSGMAARGASPVAVLFDAMGGVIFAWAFVECVSYYRQMKRRLKLGLADPVVVNRFLLWSIWTGASGLMMIELVAVRAAIALSGAGALLAAGQDPGRVWLLTISATEVSVALMIQVLMVAVWLSFSPPNAYRRWLAARAAETSTAAGG